MRKITRREALAGAASLGAVGIAGCVADNDSSGDSPENDTQNPESENDNTGNENGSDDVSEEFDAELVETTVETTGTDCSDGDSDSASAALEDGAVVVEGVLPTSNPCYEAVLADSALDGRMLSVDIDAREDRGEDSYCPSCLGEVSYEARLEFSSQVEDISTFESITVNHGGRDGDTHVVGEDDVETGESGNGEGDGEVSDGDDSGAGSDESDASTAVTGHSIETISADCGGSMGEHVTSAKTVENNTVNIKGSVSASTPCHEAIIESVGVTNGVLDVAVGVTSTTDEGQNCVQCIGKISYEATVQIAESADVEDVTVSSGASLSRE